MTNHDDAPNRAADLALLERLLRLQDGTLAPAEVEALEQELLASPAKQQTFADLQIQSAAIHELARRAAYAVAESPVASSSKPRRARFLALAVLAATVLLAVASGLLWQIQRAAQPHQLPPVAGTSHPAPQSTPEVRLSGSSRARFLGELVPIAPAVLTAKRDYVLTEGSVELAFPSGATAVIEAPAVFRIMTLTSLALDMGRCSVHAPPGAEGFVVDTPANRIVDRGTRFTVNVDETSAAEVHVVEGAADVLRAHNPTASASVAAPGNGPVLAKPAAAPNAVETALRLHGAEARRFGNSDLETITKVDFRPDLYRRGLPDRIVRYTASTGPRGGAEQLTSVTVQRGGQVTTYPIADLIPVELTWFKSHRTPDRSGHFASGNQLPEPRSGLLADTALNTGVINPGGQTAPLQTNPIRQSPEQPGQPNTPGFAVRFAAPVVNGPGPDIVFFEIQCLANPLDGDPFHVSPIQFSPQLKTHTVRSYDLTMTSPEALRVEDFYLFRFPTPVSSLAELESAECVRTHIRLAFRALAVGIDLSDLGYAADAEVNELFFADAGDNDRHCVDPVFIAGLPTATTTKLNTTELNTTLNSGGEPKP